MGLRLGFEEGFSIEIALQTQPNLFAAFSRGRGSCGCSPSAGMTDANGCKSEAGGGKEIAKYRFLERGKSGGKLFNFGVRFCTAVLLQKKNV